MPVRVAGGARPCRARSRAAAIGSRRRARRRAAAEPEPPLGSVDVAELEMRDRHAAGGEELDRPVALEPGRPMRLLAAR